MSVERDDVAYVGIIQADQDVMILLKDPNISQYSTIYATDSNPIQLLVGPDGIGNLARGEIPYTMIPLLFRVTYSGVDNEFYIRAYNFNRDGFSNLILDDSNTLSLSTQASTIRLTPIDPTMGLTDTILAGVRYEAGAESIYGLIATDCVMDRSNELGGLLYDCEGVSRYQLNSYKWTFVTTQMAAYIGYSQSPLNMLPAPIAITQCVAMPDSNYGRSDYCIDWTVHRGFTREEDVRQIIYYYSQDGTCGQAYQFNNWLGESIEVGGSLGICPDQICDYIEVEPDVMEFQCVDPSLPTPDGEVNQELEVEELAFGLITSPILWLIVIVAIILIVILSIVLIIRAKGR